MRQSDRGPAAAVLITPSPKALKPEERPPERCPTPKPATMGLHATLLRRKSSPQAATPPRSSGSLLRRVFTPSKSGSASKADHRPDAALGPADRIDDAPSIRRNLGGLFHEQDEHQNPSPVVLKAVNKRIPCRFRKKKAFSYDDTTEEIVFEQAASAEESVFETAWSSDDDNAIEPTEPGSSKSNSEDGDATDPSPEKVFHKPTALGSSSHSRANDPSSPISSATITPQSPLRNIKFLIDSGVRSVTKDMRRKSRISIKMQPKSDSDGATALDENSVKIFLLLLQPRQKIFELIQLIFSSKEGATVGDLLRAIPCNATQPDLANQTYVGLTRPKKRSRDFTDLDTPVCVTEGSLETVDIKAGEIMVALPLGYSHNRVVAMSKKILVNPRIQKLLERTNPLAPRIRKSKRRSSPTVPLQMMEKVVEEPDVLLDEDAVKKVMQFAVQLAATSKQAMNDDETTSLDEPGLVSLTDLQPLDLMTPKAKNTSFVEGSRPSVCSVPETAATDISLESESFLSSAPGVLDAYLDATSTPNRSFEAINGCLDDNTSIDSSLCSSLPSYSSWSQSFDASLKMRASTPIPVAPVVTSTKVNPYLKRSWVSASMVKLIVVRVGIAYCLIMLVCYSMDPAGCAAKMELMRAQPLGVIGAAQVVLAFLGLTKLQHYMLFGSFQDSAAAVATFHVKEESFRRLSWAPSSVQMPW